MILNQQKALVVTAFLSGCLLVAGCGAPATVAENHSDSATMPVKNSTASTLKMPTPDALGADPSKPDTTSKANMGGMGIMKFPAGNDIKFKDDVASNVEAPKSISELVFTSKDGGSIELANYIGKKNVILVFTEGFNGMLCPFCKTQTSRLVANYDRFKERNCEIIVVYPGPKDHLDEFVEAAMETEKEQVDQVPFPIVLDQEFKATNYFDIHSKHAHPSTYLIDKKGGVQFAYVGSDMTADRPSVKALIKKLDELE